jgi:hypothetical protein
METRISVRDHLPIWSILSVVSTPLTQLVGAIALAIAEGWVEKPNGLSMNYIPQVARIGVLVMLACILIGVFSAIIAMAKREKPRYLPVVGLAINGLLVVVFCFFQLYKLGFDQDRWASP